MCVSARNNYCTSGYSSCSDGVCSACYLGYRLQNNTCVKNCSSGYLEKGTGCVSSADGCGAGYRDMGGFCNRIQYTPAEAAEILQDNNANYVILTFKK